MVQRITVHGTAQGGIDVVHSRFLFLPDEKTVQDLILHMMTRATRSESFNSPKSDRFDKPHPDRVDQYFEKNGITRMEHPLIHSPLQELA
jgi:hypothetical protein